jgi:hypothetical protein
LAAKLWLAHKMEQSSFLLQKMRQSKKKVKGAQDREKMV